MTERSPTTHQGVGAFRRLLTGHSALLSAPAMTGKPRQFKALLDGFAVAYGRAATAEALDARRDLEAFRSFFPAHQTALDRWRVTQEATADDFNILEVVQLTGDEIRHSMILAWLLDHDMTRAGTHAQGSLGFRRFLAEFGLPQEYADGRYRVRREVASDESRIDIEMAERGKFLIHIENKIWSGEGKDETIREWSDLQKRALLFGLPTKPPASAVHAFYLTPDGRQPLSHDFRPISWRQIAKVVDKFACEAKPPEVSLFASHYARILRSNIIPEPDSKETEDAQGQVQ